MTETTTETLTFDDDGRFPNSALPLVLYRHVIATDAVSPEAFEGLLAQNRWPPRWRYTIYGFHHFHSTTHEALGVARGTATVMFGGPAGTSVAVGAGDGVVIPAGVGHMLIEASADFMVVGAYPPGQEADLLRGEDGDRPAADERIAAVPMPESDPFNGRIGGLVAAWFGGAADRS